MKTWPIREIGLLPLLFRLLRDPCAANGPATSVILAKKCRKRALVEGSIAAQGSRLIPARPMARSPAFKPVKVPETTNRPGGIGREGSIEE